MKNQLLTVGVMLLGLAFVPNAAQAEISGTIELKQTNETSIFGAPGERLFSNVDVVDFGNQRAVSAGLFRVTDTGVMNDYLAFCIEIAQNLGLPTVYDINDIKPDGTVISLLNELFTSFVNVVEASAVEAAGFQVAIWEIIADGEENGLDLESGDFQLADTARNMAVEDVASVYLDGLTGMPTGDHTLSFLTNSVRQDLIIWDDSLLPSEVSAPASIALILMGMGAMVFASRRKS